ncbi:MAG: undecaprenyl/decaprenyl-phosphate alpha-N-acetylglucosaminyl 1-phosphate transferase [Pyrinomonadaceae bacterium]|nr:undecaprenyl/decaprenyl-phosphate alpha-N-acetylglucosaminyl 1-phosphate transferase [Pyrinomonadaceae bacterium]
MKTYILLFVVSTCTSLVLTPVVSRISRHFGWLDDPRDQRRVHEIAVPRLGGTAIFAAILLALTALLFTNNAITEAVRANSAQLLSVLGPAAIIFLIGIYDDFHGTNATTKFLGQLLAGLLFYAMGGRIEALSVPLVGSIELHPVIGCALTLLWTVGISNAFNLIDGMDGLATGAALFAALVMLVVSLTLGNPLITVVAVVLCGSLIGFLPYNFNPASIFLGDSGSLVIGFILAALSVQGTQKASTAVAVGIPLIAFGVPVIDTAFSIVRRFIGGRPLFEGDREHIHHMLLARGWSQRYVILVLYSACALFGFSALLLLNASGTRTTGFVLFVVAAAILFSVGRLRYHEVDEVRAGIRRRFFDGRVRLANNIRVRRAARVMSNATTLNEIYGAIDELLELGDFVYATMHFGHNANRKGFGSEKKPTTDIRRSSIYRTWERGNVDAEEVRDSGRFWTLRLPLSAQKTRCGYLNLYREFGDEALLLDINYLCDLFQRETAKALERVLTITEQPESVPQLVVSMPLHAAVKERPLMPARAHYNEAPALLRVAV